jgi:hypothetical protein
MELDGVVDCYHNETDDDETDDNRHRKVKKTKKAKKLKGAEKRIKGSDPTDDDNEDTDPDVGPEQSHMSVQGRTPTRAGSKHDGLTQASSTPRNPASSSVSSPSSSKSSTPSAIDALLAQFSRQAKQPAVTVSSPVPATDNEKDDDNEPTQAPAPAQSPSACAVVVSAPVSSATPPTPSAAAMPGAPSSVIGGSVAAAMQARSYPNLPPEERVAKLAAEGLSNEQIAMRVGMSIRAVMDMRKKSATKSLIGDPRKLFAERLGDFDHDFQIIRRMFHDDPGSEIYYRAMVDFSKTMRELVKEYNDLEDPQETAMALARRCLQPFVEKVLKSVVDNVNSSLKAVAPYLRENERRLLADNLRLGMKTMQDVVNNDYNNAVEELAGLFGVDLTEVKVTNQKPPDVGMDEDKEVPNVSYQSKTVP